MWFKVSADKANKIDFKIESAKSRCSVKNYGITCSASNIFNLLNLRHAEFYNELLFVNSVCFPKSKKLRYYE